MLPRGSGQASLGGQAQSLDQLAHLRRELRKAWAAPVIALIHVEPTIDLDLQRMAAPSRIAVMVGSEASGIGCVDRDGKSTLDQEIAGGFEDQWGASRAITIT